jgi:hypothetical protein
MQEGMEEMVGLTQGLLLDGLHAFMPLNERSKLLL